MKKYYTMKKNYLENFIENVIIHHYIKFEDSTLKKIHVKIFEDFYKSKRLRHKSANKS